MVCWYVIYTLHMLFLETKLFIQFWHFCSPNLEIGWISNLKKFNIKIFIHTLICKFVNIRLYNVYHCGFYIPDWNDFYYKALLHYNLSSIYNSYIPLIYTPDYCIITYSFLPSTLFHSKKYNIFDAIIDSHEFQITRNYLWYRQSLLLLL